MSTNDGAGRRWVVPGFSVLMGIVMCLAVGLSGDWVLGTGMLGVMVAYAAVLLVFRRFESVALLGSDEGDERQQALRLRAGYFSLNAVAVFVVAGFIVDLARGGDGGPWAAIAFVGGVSFMGALVFLSRRG